MSDKKTLVLGASLKPERYSNKALNKLKGFGFEAVALGLRKGEVAGIPIETERLNFEKIHTVTLYLNPKRQEDYYEYILSLNPKRIIYNPGTENPELMKLAKEKGIENVIACTLVLISIGDF